MIVKSMRKPNVANTRLFKTNTSSCLVRGSRKNSTSSAKKLCKKRRVVTASSKRRKLESEEKTRKHSRLKLILLTA